ncbi:Rabex5/ GTPase activating Vps9 domain-containing protein 1 B [Monocercomonoides exilis]|uniref:Rabex5/ GTPase activating Vps9 domain-containing protein 1 B n=1 Tax=Monocercomonoides exilis TaxID=2049356 RepID=UPI00355A007A|nr:Rabex5/ GTPase activating Vps9 domain-containing protein 1 B [Monocercomonoides exilis]|eukprot:MONOS_11628.1-p1 / transcript=MONOS_11628.1 / gene=MONOS_11628 / organism=Monocercomonoides_exilis_PA203 / gene_product= Rabex5/ GTPase activating Vps9 domain-containing protein 1 B, putative / transcript_product= Rabex5/ GTPase activating Vps9 domain-containing protein 1 B, putative / location=Mono_scaffold00594:31924-38688(+) / protein_length=2255 / sequence_SO=supercontig / SO=protein_coding / is_pseudo=false
MEFIRMHVGIPSGKNKSIFYTMSGATVIVNDEFAIVRDLLSQNSNSSFSKTDHLKVRETEVSVLGRGKFYLLSPSHQKLGEIPRASTFYENVHEVSMIFIESPLTELPQMIRFSRRKQMTKNIHLSTINTELRYLLRIPIKPQAPRSFSSLLFFPPPPPAVSHHIVINGSSVEAESDDLLTFFPKSLFGFEHSSSANPLSASTTLAGRISGKGKQTQLMPFSHFLPRPLETPEEKREREWKTEILQRVKEREKKKQNREVRVLEAVAERKRRQEKEWARRVGRNEEQTEADEKEEQRIIVERAQENEKLLRLKKMVRANQLMGAVHWISIRGNEKAGSDTSIETANRQKEETCSISDSKGEQPKNVNSIDEKGNDSCANWSDESSFDEETHKIPKKRKEFVAELEEFDEENDILEELEVEEIRMLMKQEAIKEKESGKDAGLLADYEGAYGDEADESADENLTLVDVVSASGGWTEDNGAEVILSATRSFLKEKMIQSGEISSTEHSLLPADGTHMKASGAKNGQNGEVSDSKNFESGEKENEDDEEDECDEERMRKRMLERKKERSERIQKMKNDYRFLITGEVLDVWEKKGESEDGSEEEGSNAEGDDIEKESDLLTNLLSGVTADDSDSSSSEAKEKDAEEHALNEDKPVKKNDSSEDSTHQLHFISVQIGSLLATFSKPSNGAKRKSKSNKKASSSFEKRQKRLIRRNSYLPASTKGRLRMQRSDVSDNFSKADCLSSLDSLQDDFSENVVKARKWSSVPAPRSQRSRRKHSCNETKEMRYSVKKRERKLPSPFALLSSERSSIGNSVPQLDYLFGNILLPPFVWNHIHFLTSLIQYHSSLDVCLDSQNASFPNSSAIPQNSERIAPSPLSKAYAQSFHSCIDEFSNINDCSCASEEEEEDQHSHSNISVPRSLEPFVSSFINASQLAFHCLSFLFRSPTKRDSVKEQPTSNGYQNYSMKPSSSFSSLSSSATSTNGPYFSSDYNNSSYSASTSSVPTFSDCFPSSFLAPQLIHNSTLFFDPSNGKPLITPLTVGIRHILFSFHRWLHRRVLSEIDKLKQKKLQKMQKRMQKQRLKQMSIYNSDCSVDEEGKSANDLGISSTKCETSSFSQNNTRSSSTNQPNANPSHTKSTKNSDFFERDSLPFDVAHCVESLLLCPFNDSVISTTSFASADWSLSRLFSSVSQLLPSAFGISPFILSSQDAKDAKRMIEKQKPDKKYNLSNKTVSEANNSHSSNSNIASTTKSGSFKASSTKQCHLWLKAITLLQELHLEPTPSGILKKMCEAMNALGWMIRKAEEREQKEKERLAVESRQKEKQSSSADSQNSTSQAQSPVPSPSPTPSPSQSPSLVSADDLLPLLLYTIIQANPPNLVTAACFTATFWIHLDSKNLAGSKWHTLFAHLVGGVQMAASVHQMVGEELIDANEESIKEENSEINLEMEKEIEGGKITCSVNRREKITAKEAISAAGFDVSERRLIDLLLFHSKEPNEKPKASNLQSIDQKDAIIASSAENFKTEEKVVEADASENSQNELKCSNEEKEAENKQKDQIEKKKDEVTKNTAVSFAYYAVENDTFTNSMQPLNEDTGIRSEINETEATADEEIFSNAQKENDDIGEKSAQEISTDSILETAVSSTFNDLSDSSVDHQTEDCSITKVDIKNNFVEMPQKENEKYKTANENDSIVEGKDTFEEFQPLLFDDYAIENQDAKTNKEEFKDEKEILETLVNTASIGFCKFHSKKATSDQIKRKEEIEQVMQQQEDNEKSENDKIDINSTSEKSSSSENVPPGKVAEGESNEEDKNVSAPEKKHEIEEEAAKIQYEQDELHSVLHIDLPFVEPKSNVDCANDINHLEDNADSKLYSFESGKEVFIEDNKNAIHSNENQTSKLLEDKNVSVDIVESISPENELTTEKKPVTLLVEQKTSEIQETSILNDLPHENPITRLEKAKTVDFAAEFHEDLRQINANSENCTENMNSSPSETKDNVENFYEASIQHPEILEGNGVAVDHPEDSSLSSKSFLSSVSNSSSTDNSIVSKAESNSTETEEKQNEHEEVKTPQKPTTGIFIRKLLGRFGRKAQETLDNEQENLIDENLKDTEKQGEAKDVEKVKNEKKNAKEEKMKQKKEAKENESKVKAVESNELTPEERSNIFYMLGQKRLQMMKEKMEKERHANSVHSFGVQPSSVAATKSLPFSLPPSKQFYETDQGQTSVHFNINAPASLPPKPSVPPPPPPKSLISLPSDCSPIKKYSQNYD